MKESYRALSLGALATVAVWGVALGCGRIRPEERLDASGGSSPAGGARVVGAGGSASSGGSSGSSTNGASGGGSGGSGNGGNGGGTPEEELTECEVVPSTLGECIGDCTVRASRTLRCPGPLRDLEVAGSSVLVEHRRGDNLFAAQPNGELVPLTSWGIDTGVGRGLTWSGDSPIVVSTRPEGGVVIDPGPFGVQQVAIDLDGSLGDRFDVNFDGKDVHVLGLRQGALGVWSLGAGESSDFERVTPSSSWGRLVRSNPPQASPPKVLFAGSDGSLWISEDGSSIQVSDAQIDYLGTGPASGVVLGERLVVAIQLATALFSEDSSGSESVGLDLLRVSDDGQESTFGTYRASPCPFGYIANSPAVCEFESVPPVTFDDAVIASDLIVYQGEPWIVFIESEMIEGCDTHSSPCFETHPCTCTYEPVATSGSGRLVLAPLSDSSDRRVVELGSIDEKSARVRASTSDDGAIVVAIAGTRPSSNSSAKTMVIDYLKISP